MSETHLMTGATGFVGSALLLELLRRTDVEAVAVVRPGAEGAQARLERALAEAAQAYGLPAQDLPPLLARCTAVAGDVALRGCGVEALPRRTYTQMWHAAASLRFEDRYADEIHAVNAQGALHALDLAAQAGVAEFNHVSTAYVAGSCEGEVSEAPAHQVRPNNHYEASKVAAEQRLAAEARFGVRVFRPSIVIGHSRTLGATNFTGMYGFLRKLFGFEGVMERTQRGLVRSRSMCVLADPDAQLDLVPIDHVVADAVAVATSTRAQPGQPRYYHLTNPESTTVGVTLGAMFELLDMAPPTFVEDAAELDWLDEKFNGRIDFYRSYLRGRKRFTRTVVNQHVAFEPEERRLDAERLRPYLGWYLERLREERAQRPEVR